MSFPLFQPTLFVVHENYSGKDKFKNSLNFQLGKEGKDELAPIYCWIGDERPLALHGEKATSGTCQIMPKLCLEENDLN